jgi:hypothetical protein
MNLAAAGNSMCILFVIFSAFHVCHQHVPLHEVAAKLGLSKPVWAGEAGAHILIGKRSAVAGFATRLVSRPRGFLP